MEIIVKFEKDAKLGSGAVSQVSWETLKPFLDQAFQVRPYEKLMGLQITKDSVTATFERK